MTTNHAFVPRRLERGARLPAGILFLASTLLALPAGVGAQVPLLPLTYSAKYVCGLGASPPLPPFAGTTEFSTIVEVHNPHSVPVPITLKVVQDHPVSAVVFGPVSMTLAPNEAREFACDDFPPGSGVVGPFRKGFLEISTQRQLKVVSLYKEFTINDARHYAIAVAKKSAPGFPIFGRFRHSALFFCGDQPTPEGDVETHETTIGLSNLTDNPLPVELTVSTPSGTNVFTLNLGPRGYQGLHCHDLLGPDFEGTVIVSYPDLIGVPQLECEEKVQKRIRWVNTSVTSDMAVVEVQPIPAR